MLVAFTRSPAMTAWRTASCSVGFSSRFIGISTEPWFDPIVQPFNCAGADFPGFAGKISWRRHARLNDGGSMTALEDLFGIQLPIIQAPMAGVQDSALAIAVSNAG